MNMLCGLNEMVNFLMKTTKLSIYFPHNRCTFPFLSLQPRDQIQRKSNSKTNLTKISEQKKWSIPPEVLFQSSVNKRGGKKSLFLFVGGYKIAVIETLGAYLK